MNTEEMAKAGYAMRDAAEEMKRAVSNLDSVLERQHRFMDDWLQRFEAILTATKPAQ